MLFMAMKLAFGKNADNWTSWAVCGIHPRRQRPWLRQNLFV